MALERNRRWAWRQVYLQRSETEVAKLWAAEMVEWLERLSDDRPWPPALQDLVTQIRADISESDRRIIERYVTFQLSPPVLQSEA